MSGKPRPVRLNLPLLVPPSLVRKALTAFSWYEGRAKMLEKPPEEREAAVSGAMPTVAPTEVTKGQVEGKVGDKSPASGRLIARNAAITRRKENRSTAGAKLHVSVAEVARIIMGKYNSKEIIGGVRVDDSVPIRVAIHNAIRTGQNRDSTTIQRDSAESWPDCESPPEAIQESHAIHSRFGSERPEST